MEKLKAFLRNTAMDWVIEAMSHCWTITKEERWTSQRFQFTGAALKVLWWSFWADLFLWIANGILPHPSPLPMGEGGESEDR